MPVVINPNSGEAQDLAPAAAAHALAQGFHVPLNDAEGNPISAPFVEAQNLMAHGGYSQPNSEQLQVLLNQTHYGSAGQQALTFGEGAAKGILGPLYAAIAPHTGLTTKEDIHNREEYNPELSTAGEITGTVAGVAGGVGLPGMVGKAGEAAGLAGRALGKAGELAAKGATEAALYSASNQIHERLLGNPEEVGENILGHVGLSALLGGGVGLALAPVSSVIGKAGKLGQKAIEKLNNGDHVVGKAAEKIYDTAVDLAPLGFARPAFRYAKKAFIDAALKLAPDKGPILDQLSRLGELADKTTNAMEKNVAGIFASQVEAHLGPSQILDGPSEQVKPHSLGTLVLDHSNDPEKLINKLSNSTMVMAEAAPEISGALTSKVTSAVNFLASKIPQPQKEGLLDGEPKATPAEVTQFNRYAQVVDNPVSILGHVKNGTLLAQDIETMNAVYPQMYTAMQNAIMSKMVPMLSKKDALILPYNRRLAVSFFLQQPLDSTMKPNTVAGNQTAFGTMHLQKQMQQQNMQRARTSKMNRMDPLSELTRSQRALNRR